MSDIIKSDNKRRTLMVDPSGNLSWIESHAVLVPKTKKPKDGWRFATAEDVKKVDDANKARDAKEAKEAAAVAAKAKAEQDAKDKAIAAAGGPLK